MNGASVEAFRALLRSGGISRPRALHSKGCRDWRKGRKYALCVCGATGRQTQIDRVLGDIIRG